MIKHVRRPDDYNQLTSIIHIYVCIDYEFDGWYINLLYMQGKLSIIDCMLDLSQS
jgi:hypothetical protein